MSIMGTFDGFTAIRLGIYAAQKGLNLTGHNISNINTEGYTRQVVDQYSLVTNGSTMYRSQMDAHIGNGVYVRSISQIRDPYLDIRFRTENSSVGALTRKSEGLKSLAAVIDEVAKGEDENGLIGAQFSDFLDKVMNLTQFTSQEEYDAQVKASADALVKLFNQSASRLDEVEKNAEKAYTQDIETVNNILRNIRDLNASIRISGIHGDGALEQRDERNRLIDELSSYMKIDVIYSMEDLGAGDEVEKLTIRLANANPDPLVETDSSVLIDGIYGTQLCSPKLTDDYKQYLEEIEQYNKDVETLSDNSVDNTKKTELIKKYADRFEPPLTYGDNTQITSSIAKIKTLYPDGEFPEDQYKYLKKNGENTNRIQDAALSFDDNPNYDLTLSRLENNVGEPWKDFVSSNTTTLSTVTTTSATLAGDITAAEDKRKQAIDKEFGTGVSNALANLEAAQTDATKQTAMEALIAALKPSLKDSVTVTAGKPSTFTVTTTSGNIITEKTISFPKTDNMSRFTLKQYREMAETYQKYTDAQDTVASKQKDYNDALAAQKGLAPDATDEQKKAAQDAVTAASTALRTAQSDLEKFGSPRKITLGGNPADTDPTTALNFIDGGTAVKFNAADNADAANAKAVLSTTYSRVETVRQRTTEETKLDDNDLYGALQSSRELLTEDGEFTPADVLKNVDENAATKRGIPYYRKALDLLANKFAEEYNRANTDFMIDQDHNYVKATGVVGADGTQAYETINWPTGNYINQNDGRTQQISPDNGGGKPLNRYTTIDELTQQQKNFLAATMFVRGDTTNMHWDNGILLKQDGTPYAHGDIIDGPNNTKLDRYGNLLDENNKPIPIITEDTTKPASTVELNKQLETALRQYITEQGGIPAKNSGPLFSNRGDGDDTTGITAGNISVAASWANKNTQVVASYVMVYGDNPGTTANENVLHMGSLMDTAHNFYANAIIPDAVSKDVPLFHGSFQEMLVGIQATLADDQYTTNIKLNNHYESAIELDTNRDYTSGVDLNDEAANMMQYQKAYGAACRLMTALDEALDRLINNTGLAGR